MVCLQAGPRVIPREHYKVHHSGRQVGEVRSGVFSPSLKCGIATAFVEAGCASPGTRLDLEMRDRMESAEVVRPPFYKTGTRR
jgi:aminomethyltransferase